VDQVSDGRPDVVVDRPVPAPRVDGHEQCRPACGPRRRGTAGSSPTACWALRRCSRRRPRRTTRAAAGGRQARSPPSDACAPSASRTCRPRSGGRVPVPPPGAPTVLHPEDGHALCRNRDRAVQVDQDLRRRPGRSAKVHGVFLGSSVLTGKEGAEDVERREVVLDEW
jgi:hypothetical protein